MILLASRRSIRQGDRFLYEPIHVLWRLLYCIVAGKALTGGGAVVLFLLSLSLNHAECMRSSLILSRG